MFHTIDRGIFSGAEYYDVYYQTAYYDGYKWNVEVTTLFVLNIFGEVILAGVNFLEISWQKTDIHVWDNVPKTFGCD